MIRTAAERFPVPDWLIKLLEQWAVVKAAPKGEERRMHVTPMLYINFDKPVNVGTLEVESDGFRLPPYDTKEFTNRFAIIVFGEDLPAGTIIIRVHR